MKVLLEFEYYFIVASLASNNGEWGWLDWVGDGMSFAIRISGLDSKKKPS